ncbi:hypothetical protein ACFO9E_03340 [Streptomyces maoxianensis]|uniref:Uncharacterized protein n=1 Tax=Streptomyces maoxianensis TaxID=1459942 RepID=A0ABV9FXZ3_9ACTN
MTKIVETKAVAHADRASRARGSGRHAVARIAFSSRYDLATVVAPVTLRRSARHSLTSLGYLSPADYETALAA